MSLKEEFIALALRPDCNRRELCRRFGISPQTAYKWLKRYGQLGREGLLERSRRPLNSPKRTPSALETEVVAIRQAHPAWGGRKISHVLNCDIAPSTVTNVLHRHLLMFPWMTGKTLLAIYWQALRLLLKRTPIYDHRAADGTFRAAKPEPCHEKP